MIGIPYMGSKRRIAPDLILHMANTNPNAKHFYDLFGGSGASVMNPVQPVVVFFNRKYCKHEYYIEDIQQTGIEQLKKPSSNDFFEWAEYLQGIYDRDSHTKRVRASCRKCGQTEYAHCGLDLKGKLVRKEI